MSIKTIACAEYLRRQWSNDIQRQLDEQIDLREREWMTSLASAVTNT